MTGVFAFGSVVEHQARSIRAQEMRLEITLLKSQVAESIRANCSTTLGLGGSRVTLSGGSIDLGNESAVSAEVELLVAQQRIYAGSKLLQSAISVDAVRVGVTDLTPGEQMAKLQIALSGRGIGQRTIELPMYVEVSDQKEILNCSSGQAGSTLARSPSPVTPTQEFDPARPAFFHGSGVNGYWLFESGSAAELDQRAAAFNSYPSKRLYGSSARYPSALPYSDFRIQWVKLDLSQAPWNVPNSAKKVTLSLDCGFAMIFFWRGSDETMKPQIPANQSANFQWAWTFYSQNRGLLAAGHPLGEGGQSTEIVVPLTQKTAGGEPTDERTIQFVVVPSRNSNTLYHHCRIDLRAVWE